MLTKSLLLAVKAGLGKGETPIFPIIVFKVKEGINYSKEDINYDLFQLAIETTSKRLFPNFLFLDAPFNKEHYDGTPESEAATMGCRTRVMGNIHGSASCIGRGNLSFTSLNLPLIALESNTVEAFLHAWTVIYILPLSNCMIVTSIKGIKRQQTSNFCSLKEFGKEGGA